VAARYAVAVEMDIDRGFRVMERVFLAVSIESPRIDGALAGLSGHQSAARRAERELEESTRNALLACQSGHKERLLQYVDQAHAEFARVLEAAANRIQDARSALQRRRDELGL
jgi:hypothetical protein